MSRQEHGRFSRELAILRHRDQRTITRVHHVLWVFTSLYRTLSGRELDATEAVRKVKCAAKFVSTHDALNSESGLLRRSPDVEFPSNKPP